MQVKERTLKSKRRRRIEASVKQENSNVIRGFHCIDDKTARIARGDRQIDPPRRDSSSVMVTHCQLPGQILSLCCRDKSFGCHLNQHRLPDVRRVVDV